MVKKQEVSSSKTTYVSGKSPDRVRFHYIKGNQFRTIYIDGVYGGLTPSGLIQAAVYSERSPIPEQTVHMIEGGRLGREIREERTSRDGPVRELEVSLVMNREQAQNLVDWLTDKINVIDTLKAKKKVQRTNK